MRIKTFCIADNYILSKLKIILVEIDKFEKIIYEHKIETALKKINDYKPDLIFCEPNQKIIEHVNSIKYKNYKPCFIFISEKRKLSHKIIKYNFEKYFLINYILTPVTKNKIITSLKKFTKYKLKNLIQKKKEVLLETCSSKININIDDIYYIKRSGQYTLLKTIEKEYLLKLSLKDYENKFKKYNFERVQKSYVVNMNNIKEIKKITSRKYILILKDLNKEIKVGRTYIPKIARL